MAVRIYLTFFLLRATKSWYISLVATPGFSVIISLAYTDSTKTSYTIVVNYSSSVHTILILKGISSSLKVGSSLMKLFSLASELLKIFKVHN